MPSWDKPPEDPFEGTQSNKQRWQGFDTDSGDATCWTSCCLHELLWWIFGIFGCFGWLIALALGVLLA